MASPVLPKVNDDDWTLRCLFKRARFWERYLANELYVIPRIRRRNPTPTHPCPFNVTLNYYDRPGLNGIHLARTHHFLRFDFSIGASGATDPKMVFGEGVRHEQIEGDDKDPAVKKARDPSTNYPYKSFRWRLYILWRKSIKCPLLHR